MNDPNDTTTAPADAGMGEVAAGTDAQVETKSERKPRKRRADAGKTKARSKAKYVKLPVLKMKAAVKYSNDTSEYLDLKAMNHSDAVAELLKLVQGQTKNAADADKWTGAKVTLIAVVDEFPMDVAVVATARIKR